MSTSPPDRIMGTVRPIDDRVGAVRMEDLYDTPIDDLWSALTDPERLARWMGDVRGDLVVGGTFEARFSSSWTGPGRVEVCDAPHRLLVTLDPGGEEETEVEATLVSEGGRTRLVIEERGLPLVNIGAYGAGWQAHVEDLGRHLRGQDAGDWRARWAALNDAYQALAADLS